MSSKPKDTADERFADWLDGRMAPRDLERFEAELRVNPTLRARAEEYRRTVETVQQALRAPLPKIDVAGAVLARIAARETAAPLLSTSPWRTASRRAIWYSSGVAAAVFALLALLIEWEPPPESLDSAQRPAAAPSSATGGAAEAERRAADDLDKNEQPGAADGAVLLVQPQPAADPAVVAELDQHFADALRADVRKAEVRQPSGEVPLETASTMLPHVLLQQQATYRDAGREEASKADQLLGFFLSGDAAARDLRRAVPSGTLQVQQLRAAPPPTRASGWVGPSDREAWLVEGSGPEVYSYLARLSEVGRSCGFDVANGEVATADVQALLEPAPAGQTYGVGGRVGDQLAGGERERTKAEGETRMKEEASRRQLDSELDAVERARPVAAAPKPAGNADAPAAEVPPAEKPFAERGGAPADRAQQEGVLADKAAEKDAGTAKRRGAPAGAEQVEQKLGAANRSELAPVGAPATPPPPPETPAPRVRVVIVIERSGRAPTNR